MHVRTSDETYQAPVPEDFAARTTCRIIHPQQVKMDETSPR